VNTAALASPGHRFWPVGEAAQANREALRAHVLATDAMPDSLIAARFAASNTGSVLGQAISPATPRRRAAGRAAPAVDPARRSPARRVGRRVRPAAQHQRGPRGRAHLHAPGHGHNPMKTP
jgi:hypothetical protein